MQIFTKLRPFFSFCQLFGVIPYLVETEGYPRKKFKKFSFSLRHPVAWWFFFQCTLQAIVSFWDFKMIWNVLYEDDGVLRSHVSRTLSFFVLQEHIFYVVMMVMSRYVISKYVCFRRAVHLLQKMNSELMVDDMSPEGIPTVTRSAILGMISAIAGTIALIASNTAIFNLKVENEGMFSTVIIVVGRFFISLMLISTFSIIYLCYKITACYIQFIILDMKRPFRLPPTENVLEEKQFAWIKVVDTNAILSWKYKLKHSKQMFGHLCEAITNLNQVFSYPALVFLTLRLVSSAFSLYITIIGLMNNNNEFFQALMPACVTSSIVNFVSFLIVLKATESPNIQARLLRERIFTILSEETDLQMDDELEALLFLKNISEERIRLSAAGLFQVGLNLIPSITASILTYFTILLQAKFD